MLVHTHRTSPDRLRVSVHALVSRLLPELFYFPYHALPYALAEVSGQMAYRGTVPNRIRNLGQFYIMFPH